MSLGTWPPWNWVGGHREPGYMACIRGHCEPFSLQTFFPDGRQDWQEATHVYLKPLLGRETRKLGEKPFLRRCNWWHSNLWPLTPQSSALTTRPHSHTLKPGYEATVV